MKTQIKIKYFSETARKPEFKTKGAACADVYSSEDILIGPRETKKIKVGFGMEIPEGYQAKLIGRSGLSSDGLQVQMGTIDSDYRGEIQVIMYNSTNSQEYLPEGTRVAQLDILKVIPVEFIQSEELSETERGSGGFGSTGVL